MLCEKCGKNHATTHIKTVINGIVREYNLCGECAAKSGYATNGITGMLASMLGDMSFPTVTKQKRCEVCGATFADIAKSGKNMENIKNVYNAEEMKKQLYKVIASLKSPEEVEMFLEDLCTCKEIDYMAQRVEAARLMLDGATYQQTIGQVGISSATLLRVNRCILYGNGGYNKILATYLNEENSKGN